jgi:hypothetical protein
MELCRLDFLSDLNDYLLSLSMVRYFRAIRNGTSNRNISIQGNPALFQLPNELLWEICRYLTASNCQYATDPSNHECQRTLPSTHALLSFSSTNRQLRQLLAPIIFQRIALDGNWRRTDRILRSLLMSPQIRDHVRTFGALDLYDSTRVVRPRQSLLSTALTHILAKSLAPRLIRLLQSLPNLETLDLQISEWHVPLFSKSFNGAPVTLPTVRTLKIGMHLHCIIPCCPNVEIIAPCTAPDTEAFPQGPAFDTIVAAHSAPKLRHLELRARTNELLLDAIYTLIPHIQSLGLHGMDSEWQFNLVLPHLARFVALRTLAVDRVYARQFEIRSGACGEWRDVAYDRRLLFGRWHDRMVQANMTVANAAFNTLKSLKELWVGDYDKVTVTRSRTGHVDSLEWTRKWRESYHSTSITPDSQEAVAYV